MRTLLARVHALGGSPDRLANCQWKKVVAIAEFDQLGLDRLEIVERVFANDEHNKPVGGWELFQATGKRGRRSAAGVDRNATMGFWLGRVEEPARLDCEVINIRADLIWVRPRSHSCHEVDASVLEKQANLLIGVGPLGRQADRAVK